jgi:hypothetical protein
VVPVGGSISVVLSMRIGSGTDRAARSYFAGW